MWILTVWILTVWILTVWILTVPLASENRLEGIDDARGELGLRAPGDLDPVVGRPDHPRVVPATKANAWGADVVGDDRIEPLGLKLAARAGLDVVGLRGKADEAEAPSIGASRDLAQDVARALEQQRPISVLLGDLRRGGLRRPVVGDRRRHDQGVRMIGGELDGEQHVLRRGDIDARGDPDRCRKVDGAGDEGHGRSARGELPRQLEAHRPRGAVGEEAHGIDRLMRRPCRHDYADTGEAVGDQHGSSRLDEDPRIGQASGPRHATRQQADVGLQHRVARERVQRLDVRLHERVGEHVRVHRRGHEHRRATGHHGGGQKVIGQAMGDAADEVRGGRREHDEIRVLAGVGVHDPAVAVGGPEIAADGVLAHDLERQARHEPATCLRQLHVDVGTSVKQTAHELRRLVGCDPAADTQEDSLAS